MKLYFENIDGSGARYELPIDFKPRWSSYRRRKKFKPRYSKDGAVQTGDGRVDSRQITFNYMAASGDQTGADAEQAKDTAYRNAIQTLLVFFSPEKAPFYLIDTDALDGVGLRCEVDYLEHTDEPETIMRVGQNRFRLEMLAGVWEDLDEVSAEDTGGVSSDETFVLTNDGPLETHLYFSITALNNVETVTMTNETNGQFFTYSNTAFGAGSELIVDGRGEEFIVTLDGVDTAYALSEGSGPIEISPGANTIKYESPSGTIQYEILWRGRYPI